MIKKNTTFQSQGLQDIITHSFSKINVQINKLITCIVLSRHPAYILGEMCLAGDIKGLNLSFHIMQKIRDRDKSVMDLLNSTVADETPVNTEELNPTVADETPVDTEELNPTVADETEVEMKLPEVYKAMISKIEPHLMPQPLEMVSNAVSALRIDIEVKFKHTDFKSSDEFLNKEGGYGTYASNMSLENGNVAIQNGTDFQFFARFKNLDKLYKKANPSCVTEIRFLLDGPYFLPHPKHYEIEVKTEYFETIPESWKGGVQFIHMNQDLAQ